MRRRHEHELPAIELSGRFGERFETEVVKEMHAERHEREEVDRDRDTLDLSPLLRHVGAEQRNVSFFEEREQRWVVSPGLPAVTTRPKK